MTTSERPTITWDVVLALLTAGTSMLFLFYVAMTGDIPGFN
jgi:hypothetical protein